MSTKHPLADYPKHLQAIGTIAIEAVALQVEMADLFGRLLLIKPSVARAIFLTPKAEATRFDILRNAAEAALRPNPRARNGAREKQKAKALRKVLNLVNRGQEVVNYRHRTVHDHWEADETVGISRKLLDGKLGREGSAMPTKALQAEIKKLRVIIDEVIDLTNEFDAAPPTLTDMRV